MMIDHIIAICDITKIRLLKNYVYMHLIDITRPQVEVMSICLGKRF